MAIVDAHLRFRIITVGSCGRESDAGIYRSTGLGAALEQNDLQLPGPQALAGNDDQTPMPFVLVGDEAFPLKPYLMRPYPGRQLSRQQRVFNYRLCFFILCLYFRCNIQRIQVMIKNHEE